MSWNRLLWGVEFTVGVKGEKPVLIGTLWMNPPPKSQYVGEPTRGILFTTRALAREWCRTRQAECAERSDIYKLWRFRPVRVKETVITKDQ